MDHTKFRLWESAALTALCMTLLAACWPQAKQTQLSQRLIRLHVIAASDTAEEQAVKRRVRDAVLACLDPLLAEETEAGEARETLFASLETIAQAASNAAEGRQVTVTLGPESYPARSFAGGTLPAGRYESLRVILGEGEGHNWWGLLFPQLCLPAAQGESEAVRETLAREGVLLLPDEEGVQIRFKLLDWWGALMEALEGRE